MQHEPLPTDEMDDDVDFGDPGELSTGGISEARWERARTAIDGRDVIYLLHERRGDPMCCPFHGRDSKPSLYYYLENNTFFCFGCPDGDGYWDNIKLVARSLEITRPQALRWLEAEFHLPPMADEQKPFDLDSVEGLVVLEEEEEDPEPPLLLNVEDLRVPYVAAARRLVWAQAGTSDAAPTARELLERFYRALRAGDPVPLARVVGADVVRQLVQRAQRA